ncbi:PREDICTED: uncharacterized protein LOC107336920 isoform X2 [Acropora digitifera]|uniref:uncharacterized protein LOC107336920 isoform X2 n=1 Tax=Acropora digitifera TaxID=70779 RepID=UPI00077A655D|nr:PREDICTED: uncharacterized protein LOC107336920 isoform X2 [Acropora digitifera]
MAVSSAVVSMVRILAIIHIVVGALLILFGIADGITTVLGTGYMFQAGNGFYGVWIGTWMCIAGGLGIPGSTSERTPSRNCFAGVFMGFSITSAVFGGIIIIAYSVTIAYANYRRYYYDYYGYYGYARSYRYQRYSYSAKMGLAAVILILGIIEFATGIWVSICLCVMKPCCTVSEQPTVAFHGSTPGYAVAQGVDGVAVAVPLQASGVPGQTQPFYGYPQAGQTTIGGPVPLQAVGNQSSVVMTTSSGRALPPQYTEKSQQVPLQVEI